MSKNILTPLIVFGMAGLALGQSSANIAFIEQVGSNNTALQTQSGQANYAMTIQAEDWNIAHIIQQGNFNNDPAILPPEHPETAACFNNDWPGEAEWYQYQSGGGNQAYVELEGESNCARQWQEGNSNYAETKIVGDNNAVQQVQFNHGNRAEIYIYANNSSACQYQQGGQTSNITITGDGQYIKIYGSGSGSWP